jgi:uncharacterized protein
LSRIIDARVRLPLEYRPKDKTKRDVDVYRKQYDAVLNVSENNEKSLENLIEEMELAGVDHAIIHAEYEYGDSADELNETVAEVVQKYPLLFTGYGTISMENLKPMKAVKQVERIKELGLSGINIQPAFFGMAIDDKRLYPFYSKALELGLPVGIHTGVNYSTEHPIKNEHPLLLDQVACHFPGITLIALHASWPWVTEMVAVARKHPNILMDFGGLAPKYIGVEGSGWETMYRFMNTLLPDQLLFATDWPVFSMERALKEWRNLGLKEDVLEKILGGNAERLISSVSQGVRQ